MRILISNDDGVHARGIEILTEIAKTISNDVWVIAPELDQSGASHSLTLNDPLRIRELSDRCFAVNGTPSDCVMLAISHILKDCPPDIVLSGINNGANLADDIIYSGTVAAAMEGALLDIPSFAFSSSYKNGEGVVWDTAIQYGPVILKKLLEKKWEKNSLVNINFPACFPQDVKSVRIVHQGQRQVVDNLVRRVDPRGKPYFWIGGIDNNDQGKQGDDLNAVYHGHIAITPLTFHLTDHNAITSLEEMFKISA